MGTAEARKDFDAQSTDQNRRSELDSELPHIFETIREPLLILGGRDLRVRLANPSFYCSFQVKPEDTMGRLIYELGNGQWNIPSLREQLEKVLAKHESFENFEVEHEFEHIGRKSMLLNARKINNGTLILLAIEDMTVRRTMEEALRISNGELEQFAHVASHDLKEPLRMVTSYLKLLKSHLDLRDGTVEEYYKFAMDGAKRMTALIDNLLTHSKIGKRRTVSKVDMNQAFQRAVANLDVSIKESAVAIEKENLPALNGDSSEFVRLFQNLLSNAIKYRGQNAPKIHVAATRRDKEWVFEIRDNGIGIRPEDQNRIFEMFQRLHSTVDFPGSGIGLSTCKKIVQSYGGRIWVESELGRGSTFFFTIPA